MIETYEENAKWPYIHRYVIRKYDYDDFGGVWGLGGSYLIKDGTIPKLTRHTGMS